MRKGEWGYLKWKNTKRDDIFVWDHESDSRKWVASSLEDFLKGWIGGEISV